MITDGSTNWHYLAVKSISGLLRGIASNHNGDCLNCFHSYRTNKKLKKHEKICKNHDFSDLKMPDANNNILESKPGKKITKTPTTAKALHKQKHIQQQKHYISPLDTLY